MWNTNVAEVSAREIAAVLALIPHSTEIFRQYCKNIPRKYCKIAKIFRNLSLILSKYCKNLAMSAQNMTYAIFAKYCQN